MEKTGKKISHVTGVLARSVRIIIENILREGGALQEIRMRIGQPLTVMIDGEEQILPLKERAHIVTKEEIKETIEYMSRYSLYAYENELRQGFLTLEGGHRVGVAGKVIVDRGKVKNIQYISSLNIRIAHEVIGCADELIPYITKNKKVCHTLIISPPRCGKTTLLRDLIRQISDGNEYLKGCSVGVVDERSEIGGCYMGIVQNNLGMRTDVLDCCPKAEGMIMLIRSMSPQVVAVDEIGTAEDIHAIEYAMQCGCKLIASVHGMDMEEAARKPVLGEMIRRKMFERYIVLGNDGHPGKVKEIYDERGECFVQKVIGGILILSATAGAGVVYGNELKRYLRNMVYLRYVFGLIRGEIEYTCAPLPEIFFGVSARVKEPYRRWLKKTAEEMECRDLSGFARVWNRCTDKYLEIPGLKQEHKILIKEPGTFLGSFEKDISDRAMEMYLNKMDLEIEKLRAELASKVKVGRCLGVMAGLFFIVLLI